MALCFHGRLSSASGTYQNLAGQTSCDDVSSCPAGEYIAVGATLTSNVEVSWRKRPVRRASSASCAVCPQRPCTFISNLRRFIMCRSTSMPHAAISPRPAAPSLSIPTQCATCTLSESFQDRPDQTSCKAVSTCSAGSFISQPATLTSNVVCSACDGVTGYTDEPNALGCKSVTGCGIGFGESAPPTVLSNRMCAACIEGVTFSNKVDGSVCQAVSTCGAGQQEQQAPTAARDR